MESLKKNLSKNQLPLIKYSNLKVSAGRTPFFMKNFQSKLISKFPFLFRSLARIYYFFIRIKTGRRQTEIIFNKIYRLNNWGDTESVSGSGSNLSNTENLRKLLPQAVGELNAKIFLDIPCGDFFWMKKVDLPVEKYLGADIVKELVDINNNLYSDEKRKFILCDLTTGTLPEADIIFCRDCLPHLPNRLIKEALKRIKLSGAKYIFTSTYTECSKNKDVHVGGFRPLNLRLKPFYFPEPEKLISDPCITDSVKLIDKCIGLWKISSLPVK